MLFYICITSWLYQLRLGILLNLFYILSSLGTSWQYLPRIGMLFYIFSRLGGISRGLACYSISYHALPVGSIRQGWACYSIFYQALAVSIVAWHAFLNLSYENSSLTNSTIQACRYERYLLICWVSCRFSKWQRILDWLALQICKNFLPKISQK